MAWKETCRVEERFRFIEEFGGEVEPSLASVCRRYGVSRRTGYKWLRRYEEGGLEGLRDRPARANIQAQRFRIGMVTYTIDRSSRPAAFAWRAAAGSLIIRQRLGGR